MSMTRIGWLELGKIVAQKSDLGSGGHQDHLEAGGEAQLSHTPQSVARNEV